MALSGKRKVILWTTTIWRAILLGLKTKILSGEVNKLHLDCLSLYGFKIFQYDTPVWGYLINIGHYKYPLIIATFLIGFALLMTIKEK
jgi:hypothetical protein